MRTKILNNYLIFTAFRIIFSIAFQQDSFNCEKVAMAIGNSEWA